MNLELVEKIADAVLYEGYMLYPYRASSVKNRQRFNWGALVPQSYSAATGETERYKMQTECLVKGDKDSTLDVRVRFLHLTNREIGEIENPLKELPENFENFKLVSTLRVGEKKFQAWQEAVERTADFPAINLADTRKKEIEFSFPFCREIEPLGDENEKIAGVILRTQEEIEGKISVQSERCKAQNSDSVFKISVIIENQTPFENAEAKTREDALLHSTVSTHTILSVEGGEFISLLDPPDDLQAEISECENVGTYPVLAGIEGETDCLLSSPIILYDYPQIAPESAGELFDGLEIDEILTLRIMTLTDEEKREMRETDDRARLILERTEMMPEEQLMKMHGALRGLNKG